MSHVIASMIFFLQIFKIFDETYSKIVIVTIGKSHINQKVLEGILSLRMKNLAAPLAFPVRLTSILLVERLHF